MKISLKYHPKLEFNKKNSQENIYKSLFKFFYLFYI